ncbi:hypothetical protein Ade02nite_53050 [Paractinoplanes deccanensis]|uniref:Monooxygenase n=1 Tax=Paractinoplanes deccanensis TaxID=113561 RepID=A0ABQ3Y9J9_9ACTN|nr:DUF5990 family protein [Actinoplanes deccanensis]GID76664.1 hypothetical protein Ade02nite_53050 [Actinoplanes deccanensis]
MRIRLEGHDLPGQRAGERAHALRLAGVHVGVQRKASAELLVPAWAPSAVWELEVTAREVDGLLDVGGPWVHGRPGARFLYVTWGNLSGDTFAMFRRAKLMFGDVPTATLRAAYEGALLVGSLGLTDEHGDPVCARVRPAWSVA